ncbi:MAG: hypothetical protein V9G22_15700 [Ottowia sp.]
MTPEITPGDHGGVVGEDGVLGMIEAGEGDLGDVRVGAHVHLALARATGAAQMEIEGPASRHGHAVDTQELVTTVPVPEERAQVERGRSGGDVGVIEREGDAELEGDAVVFAGRDRAADGAVGLLRAIGAAPGFVLEVEERDVLVLPEPVLVELHRHISPAFLVELHVVHVEAKVGDRRPSVAEAPRPRVGVGALEGLGADAPLEGQRDLQRSAAPGAPAAPHAAAARAAAAPRAGGGAGRGGVTRRPPAAPITASHGDERERRRG